MSLPELGRAFLAALSAGDADAAVAVVAEDFLLRLPTAPRGVPKLVSGRAELAELVSKIGLTWTEVAIEDLRVDAFATDPGRGAARFTVDAANRDASRYRNEYLALVETEGGRIVRWTEYYDPEPMVAALAALRAHLAG